MVITIYHQLLSHYQKLESQIHEVQKQLLSLPEGELCCTTNGNYLKWYHVNNHIYTYIPKRQKEFAEQLALKKYLNTLLDDLSKEKDALQFYLTNHSDTSKTQLLLQHSEYAKLLSKYFQPISQDLKEWMLTPYERNTSHPEHLIHKSSSGNQVRSKSESIIDMLLHINKIPFRYECALYLDNTTLYPDFTIRHPQTKEFYYWEHFGLMDNPIYAQNSFSKLQLYISHGIIPGTNLITTF